MKKILLLVLLTLMIACSDDDKDVSNTDVVGAWLTEGKNYNDLMTFYADYKCVWVAVSKDDGSVIKNVVNNIEYKITKKNIILTYDEPNDVEEGVENPYRVTVTYEYNIYQENGLTKLKLLSKEFNQTTIFTKQ